MPAPDERQALTFNGKAVILYVDAPPRIARPFLARSEGATMAAEEEGVSETDYVERIQRAAAEMGLAATLQRLNDREIVFDVKSAPER
jgi:hypothetical protein